MGDIGHNSDLTLDEATEYASRYALLDGRLAKLEASRKAKHARIDAVADAAIAPIVTELGEIFSRLEAWWPNVGEELRKGKKSIELAGAVMGTKLGNAKLTTPADEQSAIAALKRSAWGRVLVRTTDSFDKAAIKKALAGAQKRALLALGFSSDQAESFFIDTSAAAKLGAGARTTRAQ